MAGIRIVRMSAGLAERRKAPESSDICRRGMAYTFFSDKRKLQIVVRMKDSPGALATVLDVLRKRVNLTSVEAQDAKSGGPILTCFAEPLFPAESPGSLEELVRSSKTAVDVRVMEGSDGLLVDSFFKGIENEDGKRLLLFTRDGVNEMFDRVVEVFGTGGEVLLYREGVSVGEANSKELLGRMSKDAVARNMPTVLRTFTASGWGGATMEASGPSGAPVVRVDDCFECSTSLDTRHNCAFVRGLLTGSASVILGFNVAYEETKCRLREDDHCEFTPVLDSLDRAPV